MRIGKEMNGFESNDLIDEDWLIENHVPFWKFEQKDGEMVFIPSDTPHMVTTVSNLHYGVYDD